MIMENVCLARQMDMAFRAISEELKYQSSGMVFVHIRNDVVGKFGIRHDPRELRIDSTFDENAYMSDVQVRAFRELAVKSLIHKRGWTHGEINFEFAMKKGTLCASVQMESNYNMASMK